MFKTCADEGIKSLEWDSHRDTPMESAWRWHHIARIYEGTNEINRMLSVGMLIKNEEGHVDLLGPASKYKKS
jgi:alkylation response protein AidB-like acyl-CoA dehydrogenase